MRNAPLLVLALLLAGESSARCLGYAPERVTLRGEIEVRTLPGPPNYKSIARGDRPDTVYFVRLAEPICVRGKPAGDNSLNWRSHANLTQLQLVMPDQSTRRSSPKRVRVTGTLLGRQSAAQRTPVVVSVEQLVANED